MYDYTFRLDRILDQEDDPPLVCDACFGRGKLIDLWGPMQCWTCQGSGIVLLSKWLANVKTFPSHIQQHMLEHQPQIWRNGHVR